MFRVIVLTLLLINISACAISVDGSMIVEPEKEINRDNLDYLLGSGRYEESFIDTERGKLFAVTRELGDEYPTVLVLHGNARNLTMQPWFGILNTLLEVKANIVAVDYSGFGRSDGEANFSNMIKDARASFDSIGDKNDVYVYGLSLGSVLAFDLAKIKGVSGVIIEGGITSVDDMVSLYKSKRILGSLVTVNISGDISFDNVQVVENIDVPVLVIHGRNDESIPLSMGENLFYSSAHKDSRLYIVENGKHCDSFYVDKDRYLYEIGTFVGRARY